MVLPDLLTVKEAAKYLKCGKDHIRDLIKRRKLKFYVEGKRFLIDTASLEQYLKDIEIDRWKWK
jgi:excisionase family DNA binding protein